MHVNTVVVTLSFPLFPLPPWSLCIAVYIHHYHRAGASYLLHLHHHTQVFHYSRLCCPVCQPSPTTAVDRGSTSVPRSSAGCLLWQGLQARFSEGRQTQNEWNCFTSVHINCLATISFHSSHYCMTHPWFSQCIYTKK